MLDEAQREFQTEEEVQESVDTVRHGLRKTEAAEHLADTVRTLWTALSAAEARNRALEDMGKCVSCVTGEERGPAVLCRFCVQDIRQELEARVGRLREALTVRVGDRLQCRGCYAYLDRDDRHTPECWAGAVLSSAPKP